MAMQTIEPTARTYLHGTIEDLFEYLPDAERTHYRPCLSDFDFTGRKRTESGVLQIVQGTNPLVFQNSEMLLRFAALGTGQQEMLLKAAAYAMSAEHVSVIKLSRVRWSSNSHREITITQEGNYLMFSKL